MHSTLRPVVCLLLALVASGADAACTATSDNKAVHLVELYTSEGCSSCPPADRWLARLPDDGTWIALAFHVDYWDSLGWKDRFADPRFTDRQRDLARRSNSTIVYTPEVALDGREWRSWQRGTPAPAAGQQPLVLDLEPGTELTAKLRMPTAEPVPDRELEAYFALTESSLSSNVRAGENAGATLHHDHVVRAFAGPLPLARAAATLSVPADLRRDHADVVAFAQRPSDGRIVGVVDVSLASCMNGDAKRP